MSTVIDEKVVSLEFDNQQFEREVKTSMKSIDNLKSKLNFEGIITGLDRMGKYIVDTRLGAEQVGDSVDKVGVKFTALQIAGITALQNITNSAINTGKRLLSSLTIDQVTAGWNKYEQKTASVQTIMNATGKSIDEVSGYLDKLMWYSDETSYGFTDMTASLAQLTSAGGKIENLIPMIEGIANATAFAGKGSAEFSRAIYNLNQSYSAGHLQYMDWKSLDLAGVSSKQLKQTFIDTAVEMGKISKGQVTIANFAETLKDKWADTSVMEKAFGKFAELTEAAYKAVESGQYDTAAEAIEALSSQYDEVAVKAFKSAQEAKSFTEAIEATKDAVSSGWMRTSEIIFGDKEEATKLWTSFCNKLWDIFASGEEKRNDILSQVFTSGWDKTIQESLMSEEAYLTQIQKVASASGEGIDELIKKYGSFSSEALIEGLETGVISSDTMSKALGRLTDLFGKYSEEQLKSEGYTTEQVEALKALNEQIQNGSLSMKSFISSITKLSGRDLIVKAFGNIYEAVSNIMSPIKEAFAEIFGLEEVDDVANKIYKLLEAFKNFTDRLKISEEAMGKIKRTFKGVFAVADILLSVIKTIGTVIARALDKVFGLNLGILDATAAIGDYLVGVRDFIKGSGSLEKFIETISQYVDNAITAFKNFRKTLSEKFDSPMFDSVGSFFTHIWDKIKVVGGKIVETVKSMAKAFGEMFTVDNLEKFFDTLTSLFIGGGITGVAVGIGKLVGVFKEFTGKITSPLDIVGDFFDTLNNVIEPFRDKAKTALLDTLAKSIVMLAASLLVLSLIDSNRLNSATLAIGALFAGLLGSLKFFSTFDKIGVKSIKQIANAGLISMIAQAILLLSIGLKVLSTIGWGDTIKSLIAMGSMFAALDFTMYMLSVLDSEKAAKGMKEMRKMAFTLILFAIPLKILSTMGWKEMGVALISMAGVFVALTSVTAILSKIKFTKANRGASKMVALAGVLALVSLSLRFLATMNWTEMGVGLISMTGVFTILTGVTAILSKMKYSKANRNISKILALTGALALTAISLRLLGTMDWQGMGVSLISMSVAFGALIGTLAILSKAKLSASVADIFALYGIAGALVITASALKILSTMDWKEMGVALISLGSTIAAFAGLLAAMKFIKVDWKGIAAIGTIAVSLIAAATALTILMPALVSLQSINWETLGKAAATFSVLIGALSGLGVLMSKFPVSLGAVPVLAASLVILAAGIAVTALALKQFNDVKWESFGMFAATLGTIVVILGVAAGLMSAWPIAIAAVAVLALSLLTAAPAFLAISVALDALTESLERLSKINFWDLVKAVLALSVAFIVATTGLLVMASLGPILLPAAGAMFIMSAAVVGMAIALEIFSKASETGINVMFSVIERFLQLLPNFIIYLGEALIALCDVVIKAAPKIGEALLVLVRTTIDTLVQAAPEIAEGLMRVIVDILTVLAQYAEEIAILVFDFIVKVLRILETYIPELTEIGVSIIIKFLESIGEALSKIKIASTENIVTAILALSGIIMLLNFIGPFIGGAIVSVLALAILIIELGLIFVGLGALTKIPGFMDLVSNGNTLLRAIDEMTKILTNIAVMASVIGSLSGLIGVALPTVLLLGVFIAEMVAILATLGGISLIPGLDKLISDGGGLLQNIGSAIGKFVGGVVGGFNEGVTASLPQMASDLSSFMNNLMPFINGIKMVDTDVIEKTSSLATALLTITGSNLLNQITNWLSGGTAMSTFGAQLVEFGGAIKGFNDAIVGITPENVTAAAQAGKDIGSMIKNLPTSGGWVDKIFGSNDLTHFNDNLKNFGTAINGFASETSNITKESITPAVDAATSLITLFKDIPTSGGWIDKIFGTNTFADFSDNLGNFGLAISDFAVNVSGIEAHEESAKTAAEIGKYLMTTMGDSGLLASASNAAIMGYFSLAVKSYANAIKSFSDSMEGVDIDRVRTGAEVGQHLSESMKIAALNTAKYGALSFSESAKIIVAAFINTFKSVSPGVANAVKVMFSNVSATIKTQSESLRGTFTSMGSYTVQGFINGIRNGQQTVVNAAAAIGRAAKEALANALRINSPSKDTEEYGDYFIEGFVNRLVAGLKSVYGASTDVADIAIQGLSTAIKQIKSVIEEGLDTNPVIRPTLDLTNLNAGVSAIKGMFTSPSLGILANAQGINYSMNNRQNGGNDSVISAIKDLKETLQERTNSISIGDISYNAGSEIDDAVKALIRAIINEGRI